MVASLDRKRTAAKARARMLELAGAADVEQAIVLHTGVPDMEAFRDEVAAATRLPAADIDIGLTGPVAGTHVGPGMVGVSLILTA